MTIHQLINYRMQRRSRRLARQKKRRVATPALKLTIRTLYGRGILSTYQSTFSLWNPQKAGKCKRLVIVTPKKPNSAQRKTAKVELSNGCIILCYIPGSSEAHGLDLNSRVLIRGGRVPDLPGVHYKIMRGKMDCRPDLSKNNARSKYGVKRDKQQNLWFRR